MEDQGDNSKDEFLWEGGIEKTWEAVREDDEGRLRTNLLKTCLKEPRKGETDGAPLSRLNIMRHLYLIIDCTETVQLTDIEPSRMACTQKLLKSFIDQYFEKNQISKLGIILLRGNRAVYATRLTHLPEELYEGLESFNNSAFPGEPSLVNGLELAIEHFKSLSIAVPGEILIIMSSLSTCDPSDINIILETIKEAGIRCSMISFSAEVRLFRYLTQQTKGEFDVVLDGSHYRDLLLKHCVPTPAALVQNQSLVVIGFPSYNDDKKAILPCVCHTGKPDAPLTSAGYICPRCSSKYCEIPFECEICGMKLMTAANLARSYSQLFPMKPLKEVPRSVDIKKCFACQASFTEKDKTVYYCEICKRQFCHICNTFMQNTMNMCTGCADIPNLAWKERINQVQENKTNEGGSDSK
ncbi:general transcription factor IIH subunit 2-like [Teleopsis dalmanni]|uniref:general transcription factor IIH subunit 2-like n=1 Tax=Teleopsis dalmanni TaxID=139649 RepID=UPI0018CCBA70|nr:general transcription factor IIH subunit 2-like [Teleopsis dalmanni]